MNEKYKYRKKMSLSNLKWVDEHVPGDKVIKQLYIVPYIQSVGMGTSVDQSQRNSQILQIIDMVRAQSNYNPVYNINMYQTCS